jgi:hypothetical protein
MMSLSKKIGVSMAIECFRDVVCKPFLCDVMPVGLFHPASGNSGTCSGPSGAIRAASPLNAPDEIILVEQRALDLVEHT